MKQNNIDSADVIVTGYLNKEEDSIYIRHLKGIDSAFNYISNRWNYKKSNNLTNLELAFFGGFVSGLIFTGILMYLSKH